jgi:Leucine-rich repeat (LRR) protein
MKTEDLKILQFPFQLHSEGVARPYLNCRHNLPGPFTTNLKIRVLHPDAATIDLLNIDFQPASFIFSGIGESFPKLNQLEISQQKIKIVERENFLGLQNLWILSLFGNEIEFVAEDAFWDLPNLKLLNLGSNRIKQISDKVFSRLGRIEELSINWNPESMTSVDFIGISNAKLYNETNDVVYYQNGRKLFRKT